MDFRDCAGCSVFTVDRGDMDKGSASIAEKPAPASPDRAEAGTIVGASDFEQRASNRTRTVALTYKERSTFLRFIDADETQVDLDGL
jgi:hypothetical protein